MKKNISLTIFLIMLCLLALTCRGQSFHAYPGYSAPVGKMHKQKTIGQKIRTKIQYARKRHNNEAFAQKERKRKLKLQGYTTK